MTEAAPALAAIAALAAHGLSSLPSLAFVYWPNDVNSNHETEINAITLTGSLLGQLIFGFLADRYGRRKLYGLELIVVIFGTLGFVESSAGYNGSMNIIGWIMFWRFFVGLGIGWFSFAFQLPPFVGKAARERF